MKEKKEKPVEVRKVEGEKTLREITVKIGLTQEEDEEEIVVEVFLNSGATGLVMNLEFARKKKFRKKLDLESCYKSQRRFYFEKEKDISIVKNREKKFKIL